MFAALLNTLTLLLAVSLLAIPVGTLCAWLVVRTDVPGRRLFWAMMLVMIFFPLYLQAAGWEAGFGQQGWWPTMNPNGAPSLDGWRGAVWVHAVAALPWVVLIVGTYLRSRPGTLEAAASIDASPLRVFWSVGLSQALPAMGTAMLWILAVLMSEISVTDLFQVRTLAEETYRGFALDQGTPVGSLQILLGLLISGVVCVWFLLRLLPPFAMTEEADSAPLALRRWRLPGRLLLIGVVLVVMLLPLASLLYKVGVVVNDVDGVRTRSWSLEKGCRLVADAPFAFRRELGWSLLMAHTASLLSVLIGLPLVWWSRHRRWVAVGTVSLVALTLAVSGPTLGVQVIGLFQFASSAWLEYLYSHTILAPTLVLCGKAFPLVVLVLWLGIRAISDAQLEAAELQGASGWTQLFRLVLPWKWPVLVASWSLGMAVGLSELSGSILTVPPGVTTLSIRTFGLLHYGVEDRLAALCLATLGLLTLLLVVAVLAYARLHFASDSRDPVPTKP